MLRTCKRSLRLLGLKLKNIFDSYLKMVTPDPSTDLDHVVLCTWGLGPGGAERQWVYLAESLINRGITVTFVTYEPLLGSSSHYLPLLCATGVQLFDASKLDPVIPRKIQRRLSLLAKNLGLGEREVQAILRLVAAFRALAPTVVYSQLDEPNIFAGIAARLCGVRRLVMSFRSLNPTHFDWILRPWILPSYRWLTDWRALRYAGNGKTAIKSYADWIGLTVNDIAQNSEHGIAS